MRRTLFLLFTALILGTVTVAQTADEIVAKSVAARGGLDRILAVKTLRMTGDISFGGGDDGAILVGWKRPGKFRQDLTLHGKSILRATDGSNAWTMNQLAGDADAKPLPPEQMDGIAEQADFDKPLVQYKEKGSQIEFLGKDILGGKTAYKLKVTLKNGTVRYEWLDPETYLETRWQGKVSVGGNDIEFATTFSDYRTVDGLKFPFVAETETIGSDRTQKIVFTKIEVNPPIPDDWFAKPDTPAPAGKSTQK